VRGALILAVTLITVKDRRIRSGLRPRRRFDGNTDRSYE